MNSGKIKFWGTRGTFPIAKTDMLKYGGNTSCIEVISPSSEKQDSSVIIDGGSGIVGYGDQAWEKGIRNYHIIFSHTHYDHILGFTKFLPLFQQNSHISIYGQTKNGLTIKDIFEKFFSFPFFPVTYKNLSAKLTFHEIKHGGNAVINDIEFSFQSLNHPQKALGIKGIFKTNDSFVYATDHEHGTSLDNELSTFCQKSNLLIYDSSFCNEDFKLGWGHSTSCEGALLAKKSGCKSLGIFHHEPDSSDEILEKILLPQAQEIFPASFLCMEGRTFNLSTLLYDDLLTT
jgi:phosphoribosyl 1,2-cyclic phosphodiesterase